MSDPDKMVRPGDDGVEQLGYGRRDPRDTGRDSRSAFDRRLGHQHFSKPQNPPPTNDKPSAGQGEG
jgi:hypothetical protein